MTTSSPPPLPAAGRGRQWGLTLAVSLGVLLVVGVVARLSDGGPAAPAPAPEPTGAEKNATAERQIAAAIARAEERIDWDHSPLTRKQRSERLVAGGETLYEEEGKRLRVVNFPDGRCKQWWWEKRSGPEWRADGPAKWFNLHDAGWMEIEWRDGTKNGHCSTYDANGRLVKRQVYSDDLLQRTEFPDGRIVVEKY